MKITNKTNVALISTLLVAFAFVASNVAVAQEESVEDLLAQLNALQSTLATLESSTTTTPTTTVAGAVSNAACPNTWSRNLTIGSTGNDVRQLQRFLNGNPQTRVATSGVGSPSNESAYYGPATARAVSKFQELHAAQILTPLGLTSGTGGFYTSTRNQANNVCKASAVNVGTTTPTNTYSPVDTTRRVAVSGDSINVSAGRQPGDSQAVKGAQRVPFTTFVISTGSDSVTIEGIKVRRFGLSSSDNLAEVALVDTNGIQIGSARSLNSRDEATLGGNLEIPRNSSVTLIAVANISDVDTDINSGSVLGLEIVEVVADVDVNGSFPIKGAAHVITESIDLQTVKVTVDALESEIDFDTDTEVTNVEIELSGENDADEEDAYLRSITLEQSGSADEDEIGDVSITVDGDSVDSSISVDGDRYIITFGGRGYKIDEGEDVDLIVEVNTDEGTDETVRFELDEVSDVYVVGADFGFGLPVVATNNGGKDEDLATIQSGDISDGGNVGDFQDEISYGRDKVIGALEVEFEGEDIEIEDLEFNFRLKVNNSLWASSSDNAWQTAGESEVELTGIELRVDGERVAFADDDVSFAEPTSATDIDKTETFSDRFTVDVKGEREVKFEVVADLDEAWSNFDGAEIEVTLIGVDRAEGVRSEKDYTGTDPTKQYFNGLSTTSIDDADNKEFESVAIKGNIVDFKIVDDNVSESEFVAGAEDVLFATLEIDAEEAVDDVEIKELQVTFEATASGNLSHVENCYINDADEDEVADEKGGSLSGTGTDTQRFDFKRFVVDAGEEVEVDIFCDIDDKAEGGHSYQVSFEPAVTTGTTRDADYVEYEIGREDFTFNVESASNSDIISVTSGGDLTVTTDYGEERNAAITVGKNGSDNVEIITLEFDAEGEDVEITDFYLTDVTLAGSGDAITADLLNNLITNITLEIGGKEVASADSSDFTIATTLSADANGDGTRTDNTVVNFIHFDRVNSDGVIKVSSGDVDGEILIEFEGIDKNSEHAGEYLDIGGIVVLGEGKDTDEEIDMVDLSISKVSKLLPFSSAPTISSTNTDVNLGTGVNSKEKIYEFTVSAPSEGDIYLNQVAFDVSVDGVTFANVKLVEGDEFDDSENLTSVTALAAGDGIKFAFTEPEEISRNETVTFSLFADVGGVAQDESASVSLSLDTEHTDTTGREWNANVGNFVWSPNGLENDGATSSNADWFNGWPIFDSGDAATWDLNE